MNNKKRMTLARWLIQKTNTESYRAGKLSGWKHPEVDQKLMDAVGGPRAFFEQAKILEQDPKLGRTGKIKFDWHDMGGDISRIHYDVSIVPELCKKEDLVDPRVYQKRMIANVRYWKEQSNQSVWILDYYNELLAKLMAGKEDCEFFHWGDMDFGGITIFQFIKEKIFPKLKPYKMNVSHFMEAIQAGAGIPLKAVTREKLIAKDAGVLTDLKNVILETNMTIEQELLL